MKETSTPVADSAPVVAGGMRDLHIHLAADVLAVLAQIAAFAGMTYAELPDAKSRLEFIDGSADSASSFAC